MELTGNNKPCIVSVGIGHHYGPSLERLKQSLNFHGWAGGVITWSDEYPPDSPSHEENPYAFKLYAIHEAVKRGYTHILYVDASFYAVADPMPIFDFINDKGVYAFRTGYNVANTATDLVLSSIDMNRDEAEGIVEYAGGAIGFNFFNPDAQKIHCLWKEYYEKGLFKNSRNHDNQSADPRFKHARQDQTMLSIAIYKAGVTIKETEFVAYYGGGFNKENLVFFIKGI